MGDANGFTGYFFEIDAAGQWNNLSTKKLTKLILTKSEAMELGNPLTDPKPEIPLVGDRISVTLPRHKDKGLGISFQQGPPGLDASLLYIEEIVPGGMAEKSGVLAAGDILESVAGLNVTNQAASEVVTMLKAQMVAAVFVRPKKMNRRSSIQLMAEQAGKSVEELAEEQGVMLACHGTTQGDSGYYKHNGVVSKWDVNEESGAWTQLFDKDDPK